MNILAIVGFIFALMFSATAIVVAIRITKEDHDELDN